MSDLLVTPWRSPLRAALSVAALALVAGCASPLDGSRVVATVSLGNTAGASATLKLDNVLGDGDGKDLGATTANPLPALSDGTKINGEFQISTYGPRTLDYKIFEKGARIAWVRCWSVDETEAGPRFAHNYTGDKTTYRIEATPTFAACADVQN